MGSLRDSFGRPRWPDTTFFGRISRSGADHGAPYARQLSLRSTLSRFCHAALVDAWMGVVGSVAVR